MIAKYTGWIDKKYPQNYLIQRPVTGSVLLSLYCLLFVLIYKPFNLSASGKLSFEATMLWYAVAMIPPHILLVAALRKISFFADQDQWSIRKELGAILLILAGLGTFVFIFGFLMQGPSNRLNFATFIDSCKIVFLTCAILYGFLMLINLRHMEVEQVPTAACDDSDKEIIRINSKLKNEVFWLHLSDLIYIESEGNYVVFHLLQHGCLRKETIRTSISEVERILGNTPFIVRTHRAFIVNIKKINKRSGNSSGYRLDLEGAAGQIPVSRSNVEKFDCAYAAVR